MRYWQNPGSFHKIWCQSTTPSHYLYPCSFTTSPLTSPSIAIPVHALPEWEERCSPGNFIRTPECHTVVFAAPIKLTKNPFPHSFVEGKLRFLNSFHSVTTHFFNACPGCSNKIGQPLKRNYVGLKLGLVSGDISSASCLISSSAFQNLSDLLKIKLKSMERKFGKKNKRK